MFPQRQWSVGVQAHRGQTRPHDHPPTVAAATYRAWRARLRWTTPKIFASRRARQAAVGAHLIAKKGGTAETFSRSTMCWQFSLKHTTDDTDYTDVWLLR